MTYVSCYAFFHISFYRKKTVLAEQSSQTLLNKHFPCTGEYMVPVRNTYCRINDTLIIAFYYYLICDIVHIIDTILT